VTVALDPENRNTGYLLGRLFAALEQCQRTAASGKEPKSGIRERYYASASATPTAAFPTLMKLKNHHLAKIENRGAVVNLERLLGSIIEGIVDFPSVLPLADQGRFALGYYHQRQAFFTKANDGEESSHA
jgi:CRISPR-associated protein Csd1